MALEKKKIMQQFEVQEDGTIFLKELNQIVEDGVVLSSVPHRTPIYPGDDIAHLPYENLKATAKTLWTDEVKKAFKDKNKVK